MLHVFACTQVHIIVQLSIVLLVVSSALMLHLRLRPYKEALRVSSVQTVDWSVHGGDTLRAGGYSDHRPSSPGVNNTGGGSLRSSGDGGLNHFRRASIRGIAGKSSVRRRKAESAGDESGLYPPGLPAAAGGSAGAGRSDGDPKPTRYQPQQAVAEAIGDPEEAVCATPEPGQGAKTGGNSVSPGMRSSSSSGLNRLHLRGWSSRVSLNALEALSLVATVLTLHMGILIAAIQNHT
jgi:hypothetical protein